MMKSGAIGVTDSTVTANEVDVVNKDVADYFKKLREDSRVEAFVRAVEVGTFCLEHASATQDLEFVRRQVESLMAAIERSVSAIPAELENTLMTRIGTADGQVLAPIQSLIDQALKTTGDRLNDVRAMLNDIDPSKDSSAAGRVVRSLRDLLDANRTDSVQATIAAAVRSLTSTDGALAKTVQVTVESALTPLRDELDSRTKRQRRCLCQSRQAGGISIDFGLEVVEKQSVCGTIFESE